jgi:hypothetical protein
MSDRRWRKASQRKQVQISGTGVSQQGSVNIARKIKTVASSRKQEKESKKSVTKKKKSKGTCVCIFSKKTRNLLY